MYLGPDLRDSLLGVTLTGTAGVNYYLREVIGEGGQGWIYKANYKDPDGFWVVVKVLRPERFCDDALTRFERETEVLKMLGALAPANTNIVRYYDQGTHPMDSPDGEIALPFIVLEFVDGQTLEQVIKAHGGFGLPAARVQRVMRQVAVALQTVHERRIIHRDLKPSNILLQQQDGQELVKVTDFGLVKAPQISGQQTTALAGASLGYAPPEQYELGNARVSAQTDVFAFASILYEALSGQEAFPPKPGDNPLRVMIRMQTTERPALARVSATISHELRDRPDLVAAIDRELLRATNPDPPQRHPSIRELWMKIEPILQEVTHKSGMVPSVTMGGDGSRLSVPLPFVTAQMPSWKMPGTPIEGEQLRAGVFTGRSIMAVGARGLYHFAHGLWSTMHLPVGVDARLVRSITRVPGGKLLIYGDTGLAVILSPTSQPDRLMLGERDITLLGAHADAEGALLVGEKLSRPSGVLIEIRWGTAPIVRLVEGTTRLLGVTRSITGAIIACGASGALLEIRSGSRMDIAWGRTGHLHAITASPEGGAHVVGSGGHALRVEPPSGSSPAGSPHTATLEAVQTTRDLRSVSLDTKGHPWAVGGQARLMQRAGGVWMRVPLDPSAQGNLIAVSARDDGVTVLGEDGSVYEGTF